MRTHDDDAFASAAPKERFSLLPESRHLESFSNAGAVGGSDAANNRHHPYAVHGCLDSPIVTVIIFMLIVAFYAWT